MLQQDGEAVAKAKAIFAGQAIGTVEALDLIKQLKKKDEFRWGRGVLNTITRRGVDPSLRLRIAQEWALCTYKDPDLPALDALNRALRILREGDDPDRTTDQETLGLAGAIHKRFWQATGQKRHLERSLHYYRRGYELDPVAKEGYTSINAAFVLDQLADIEQSDAAPTAEQRRREARAIRQALTERLPVLEQEDQRLGTAWWYLVTVAEAFFGLGHYCEAGVWLQRAKALPEISDWEFRSTAFQLATLYQLQQAGTPPPPDPASSDAARVLDAFIGSDVGRKSAFIGKVGLALSGGGFRASLFHIGVLARLAEVDLLRHVEVLSCVSGGSIIGAHYYLQLRETLETRDLDALDDDAIRDVYVQIVQRVASDFLAGVQRNLRTRVFANPVPMLRTVFDKSYSRTVRLGELIEQELFSRVFSEQRRPEGPLHLNALTIRPLGAADDFEPKKHNWHRKAKVPVLFLNATTLNTGHNWQYTASYMGESPHAIDPNVDGTNRLRRVYYKDAPIRHRDMRLTDAVVASACVPGLFEPIRLDGLYQRKERGNPAEWFVVRQVDGGVHDNQGIASLFEQDCSVILVSDASGQTTTVADPGGGMTAPLLDSNAVLMQRVRQEQFARLKARRDGGLLKGTMFIHLKQDLEVEPIDWLGCQEPSEQSDPARSQEPLTSYGIRKEVQELLAGLRTDLDSFSDSEAWALMTSGYRMAERFLPEVTVLPARQHPGIEWPFLEIEQTMTGAHITDPRYCRLIRLLSIGSGRLFRVWRQSRALLLGGGTVVLALLGLLVALLAPGVPPLMSITVARSTSLVILLAAAAAIIALMVPKVREHAGRVGTGLLSLVAWIPALLHLWVVDPLFLKYGRLDRPRQGDQRRSNRKSISRAAAG
jgi:predicted acylesterase/phospholipase RssA